MDTGRFLLVSLGLDFFCFRDYVRFLGNDNKKPAKPGRVAIVLCCVVPC